MNMTPTRQIRETVAQLIGDFMGLVTTNVWAVIEPFVPGPTTNGNTLTTDDLAATFSYSFFPATFTYDAETGLVQTSMENAADGVILGSVVSSLPSTIYGFVLMNVDAGTPVTYGSDLFDNPVTLNQDESAVRMPWVRFAFADSFFVTAS